MIFVRNLLIIFNVVSLTLGRHAVDIYSGEDADIRDFPYMAALSYNGKSFQCGGAIINENTILTAAHCVTFFFETGSSDGFTANYGSAKFNETTLVNITNIYKHEKFVKIAPFLDDIAVLKVDPPIVFSETAQPIKLPQMNAPNPEGKLAKLTGWGATNINPNVFTYPNNLQKVNMTIAENETCENLYHDITFNIPVNTEKQICAISDTSDGKRRGSCFGDSGGPLVIDGVHYGIVSFGVDDSDESCGSKKYPTIFTRTANYIDWLSDKL